MTYEDCPQAKYHGNPFRYCACGWMEEPEPAPSIDPSLGPAQTSTPLRRGGPHAQAAAAPDGWNVNVHFRAGNDERTYVFDVEQTERFIESIQRALTYARSAAETTVPRESQ